jgi:phage terminase large subunit
VDFYVPESDDLEEWIGWLDAQGYRGNDYVPHDIVVTEWGSKRTRFETLIASGRRPIRIAKVAVGDGLQAGRVAINAAIFHADDVEPERAERVARGIEGLKAYRREWDDELKTFREHSVKDWAEHIGSAWRYLGLAWKEVHVPEPKKAKPFVPRPGVPLQPPPTEKVRRRI